MRNPFNRSQLTSRINKMVSQARHAHPDMDEAAAQVFVGDVYSLREQGSPTHSDGWKNARYAPDYKSDVNG
jgi:hypothetical protein